VFRSVVPRAVPRRRGAGNSSPAIIGDCSVRTASGGSGHLADGRGTAGARDELQGRTVITPVHAGCSDGPALPAADGSPAPPDPRGALAAARCRIGISEFESPVALPIEGPATAATA
jgi:hypothetical protein